MTFDCCGGSYLGNITSDDGATTIVLENELISANPGGALCVLNGTNAGDCRRIITYNNETNMNTLNIDKPFVVPLDTTSIVTAVPYQGTLLFVGNNYVDGGAVQLYGQAIGCMMAENTFERTGGLMAWARSTNDDGFGTNVRNQFIDNHVVEGNHVFNYNTHPTVEEDSRYEAYFVGGSKIIEPWFFGSLTNDQGPPVEARWEDSLAYPFQDAFNRLIVFKNNVVDSNGGIEIRGTSANILVENNKIYASDVGIHVNYTTTKGGIVVKNNIEPDSCSGKNYNPYVNTDGDGNNGGDNVEAVL